MIRFDSGIMRSCFKWFGGKFYFLKYLLPFPIHTIYVEPFGGSGVVLLNKSPSKVEVYNDLNLRLLNAFRTLQNHHEELQYLAQTNGAIRHRALFEKYKELSPDSLEDAFHFFYINRYSFSGTNDTFAGVSMEQDKRIIIKEYWSTIDLFDAIHDRIKHVNFECQDFRTIIKRMDTPNTFYYLDPPYATGGESYAKMVGGAETPWTMRDYRDLITLLGKIQGKFLLSTDLTDYALFDWYITPLLRINNMYKIDQNWKLKHGASTTRTKDVEYLISNYDPATVQTQTTKNQCTLDQLMKK